MPRWLIKPIGTGGAMSEKFIGKKCKPLNAHHIYSFLPCCLALKAPLIAKNKEAHFLAMRAADDGERRRIRKHTSRGKEWRQEELRHKAGVRVRPAELQLSLKANVKTLI